MHSVGTLAGPDMAKLPSLVRLFHSTPWHVVSCCSVHRWWGDWLARIVAAAASSSSFCLVKRQQLIPSFCSGCWEIAIGRSIDRSIVTLFLLSRSRYIANTQSVQLTKRNRFVAVGTWYCSNSRFHHSFLSREYGFSKITPHQRYE